ncbi:unnamed protein product [Pylaiella littoralis]
MCFSRMKGVVSSGSLLLLVLMGLGTAAIRAPTQDTTKALCWIDEGSGVRNTAAEPAAPSPRLQQFCWRSNTTPGVYRQRGTRSENAFGVAARQGWGGRPVSSGTMPSSGRSATSLTTMMAGRSASAARRKENVAGNLFVDESCINCDTCRWMQGDIYVSEGGKSAVARQPETEEEKRGAYRAMLACPTASIRLEAADPVIARDALKDFPFPVDSKRLPGVFHLGFHDENSFGCSPWLVQRAEGNLMMDSPRFHPALAKALEDKGGVSLMVMSHIDDVGDHQRWKERFPGMKRVMHKADVQSYGDTSNVEVQLESDSADGQIGGYDFWCLGEGLRAVHTPGHSRGSITLLYSNSRNKNASNSSNSSNSSSSGNDDKPAAPDEGSGDDEGIAFTGDHLALSGYTGALTGFPRYGYDLKMQSTSMELLARPDVKFRWILPGHGRMTRFNSHEDRTSQILAAAAKTKAGRT